MFATPSPFPQFFDADGSPLDNGELFYGIANLNPETNPLVVYWDAAGTQPAAQPIRVMNGYPVRSGTPANVYSAFDYSLTVRDRRGRIVYYIPSSVDIAAYLALQAQLVAFQNSLADTSNPLMGDALVGVKGTFAGDTATTQHQVNEERSSVFRKMSPAQIAAILAATGSAAAVCSTELQSALDTLPLSTLPAGTYQLTEPLRIKAGTPRATMRGENRIRSIFQPNAISIAVGPANINTLFLIQDNNAHFCLSNMRMTSSVGYTGVGVYSLEGGGADGSGQCLFSGLIENLWIDFSSTNSGFWTGTTQNTVFQNITFENMKGGWTQVGVGSGDNFYRNLSFYNCFDQVGLQTADTNGSFAETWDGIHAYSHQRGRLFDKSYLKGCEFSNITLEPATGNLGTTGLFKFANCIGTQVSNFKALTRAGVPACETGIELDTHVGKFTTGAINANIGLKLAGTGAHDVEFVNVDFTNCNTAAFQVAANCGGTIRTRGCKFNDTQVSCMVSQVVASFNWYSFDDEFINAGLGGNAGSRCIDIATSGNVVMVNPRIGRTNGGAAAQYFVQATGAGLFDIFNVIWVGTPPVGLIAPGSTQTINFHTIQAVGSVTVTVGTTYFLLASDYDVIANRAGTVTVAFPPAALNNGREYFFKTIQNQAIVSASADVVPLAGGAAGTALVAATAGKWVRTKSDGASWVIMAGN